MTTFLTDRSQQDYADFEHGRENRELARKAIEKRKRAFVEIDILQAVMHGENAEAERLAAGMTRDERAELIDHIRTMRVILDEADDAER